MKKCSRVENFYKRSCAQRVDFLKDFATLHQSEIELLKANLNNSCFVHKMSENVISAFSLPYSVAPNFLINDIDYIVPMVTEEPSVVAAASNAAKLCRDTGGFSAVVDRSLMIGQIYLTDLDDRHLAASILEKHKLELLELANKQDDVLIGLGGGAVDLVLHPNYLGECEANETLLGQQSHKSLDDFGNNVLAIHLIVDVKDAMGANIVNTMVEAVALKIEHLIKANVLMSIVSNLSTCRLVRASATWSIQDLGSKLISRIIQANTLAQIDVFRAVTHNKGIMNGIDAVAIATGNDFRAIESGAHGFAGMNNGYKPLTQYRQDSSGNLVGSIELPLAVGVVGGATKINPMAALSLKILGTNNVRDLSGIMASVGLAQNFAALKALVGSGIQFGHMKLHSKNIAVNAGVPEEFVDVVAQKMIQDEDISVANAKNILGLIRNESR